MSSYIKQGFELCNKEVESCQLPIEGEESGKDDWINTLKEDEEELQNAMDKCLYPWHHEDHTVVTSSLSQQNLFNPIRDFEPTIISNTQNEILERLKNIESSYTNIYKEHSKMCLSIKKAHKQIDKQMGYITFLEQEVSRLDQYGRRENVEILGIPAKIQDDNLESEVIKILHKIGLTHITHYSIVGCHRIGNKDKYGSRSTIVRFLHRKDATSCLKNKKLLNQCRDLGFYYLTIVENLCPSYRSIFEDLEELKYKGLITQYWINNGKIKYKKTANKEEKPIQVLHDSDLDMFYYDDEGTYGYV